MSECWQTSVESIVSRWPPCSTYFLNTGYFSEFADIISSNISQRFSLHLLFFSCAFALHLDKNVSLYHISLLPNKFIKHLNYSKILFQFKSIDEASYRTIVLLRLLAYHYVTWSNRQNASTIQLSIIMFKPVTSTTPWLKSKREIANSRVRLSHGVE